MNYNHRCAAAIALAVPLLALGAMVLIAAPARADSPLTSTPFHQTFTEDKMVMKAARERVMSFEFGDYLTSPKVSIAQKAALINALSVLHRLPHVHGQLPGAGGRAGVAAVRPRADAREPHCRACHSSRRRPGGDGRRFQRRLAARSGGAGQRRPGVGPS